MGILMKRGREDADATSDNEAPEKYIKIGRPLFAAEVEDMHSEDGYVTREMVEFVKDFILKSNAIMPETHAVWKSFQVNQHYVDIPLNSEIEQFYVVAIRFHVNISVYNVDHHVTLMYQVENPTATWSILVDHGEQDGHYCMSLTVY